MIATHQPWHMPPADLESWIAFGFIAIVALLFVDHARHTWQDWRRHRDARALRALILGIALAAATVGLATTSAFRVGIIGFDLTVQISYVVRGLLIVSALTIVLSWYIEGRDDD